MNHKRIFPAALALALSALACQSLFPQTEAPPPTQPGPALPTPGISLPATEDQVPRIGVKEAKAAYDSGAAIFVDTRDAKYYAQAHIPNALSIPLEIFEFDISEVAISLQKEQWIIAYCT